MADQRKIPISVWLIYEMKERPLEALQEQRDKLTEELHTVYSGAPSTTFKAYKKAQKALQTSGGYDFFRHGDRCLFA